jgi:hypothetical protein
MPGSSLLCNLSGILERKPACDCNFDSPRRLLDQPRQGENPGENIRRAPRAENASASGRNYVLKGFPLVGRGVESPVKRDFQRECHLDERLRVVNIDGIVRVEEAQNNSCHAQLPHVLQRNGYSGITFRRVDKASRLGKEKHVHWKAALLHCGFDEFGSGRDPSHWRMEQSSIRSAPPVRADRQASKDSAHNSKTIRLVNREPAKCNQACFEVFLGTRFFNWMEVLLTAPLRYTLLY